MRVAASLYSKIQGAAGPSRELPLRTERPIKQVAQAAGFRNEKSFIRAFRNWTGQSPAEFRRTRVAPI